MGFRPLVLAMFWTVGCAASNAAAPAAKSEAPAWAALAAGPMTDGDNRYLQGVGAVGPELEVKNAGLRRNIAEGRARTAIDGSLARLVGFLGKRWYETTRPDEEVYLGLMTKTFYSGAAAHIAIVETVVAADGVQVWARAQLPLTAVAETLAKYDELRPWSDYFAEVGLEAVFDAFVAESAARAD